MLKRSQQGFFSVKQGKVVKTNTPSIEQKQSKETQDTLKQISFVK